jgi:hypothetical protein
MSVYAEQLRQVGGSAGRVRPWVGLLRSERDRVFTLIMLAALVTFELFNFSTTEFALKDLLGGLRLGTAQWATILALAFSAVDFAGVAWLFSPKPGVRVEAWYLVGAWLLAATMNATLTWWSVSLALLQHESLGNEIIARETLLSSAPVFVAGLIWLLRVLLIGSFTLASRRPSGAELQPVVATAAIAPSAPTDRSGRSVRRTLIARPIRQR